MYFLNTNNYLTQNEFLHYEYLIVKQVKRLIFNN